MQMRAIEKEMADEAYRISHILWDFPLRLEANIQMWPNRFCKRRRVFLFLTSCTNKRWASSLLFCVFIYKGATSSARVEFLSYAATGPAFSLQILSENVSDPPTLIPLLLLLLLFFLSCLVKTSLHQSGGPKNSLPQHCQCIALHKHQAPIRQNAKHRLHEKQFCGVF